MKNCVSACKAVIQALDDCVLRSELQEYVASIFLELPEDPPEKHWHPAVRLMEKHAHSPQWPVAMKAWNAYVEGGFIERNI